MMFLRGNKLISPSFVIKPQTTSKQLPSSVHKYSTKPRVNRKAKTVSTFKPTFKHVIESFLDSYATPVTGIVWNVTDPGRDKEFIHWSDPRFSTSFVRNGDITNQKQIVRVKIETLNQDVDRFVEIHFSQRILLAYEHKYKSFSDYLPEAQKGKYENALNQLRKLMDTRPVLPGREQELRTFKSNSIYEKQHFYLGLDIPTNWLTAFKSVKYLANYVPPYLDDINYFEFFRYTASMDDMREKYTIGNNEEDSSIEAYDEIGNLHLPLPEQRGVKPIRYY